MSFFQNLFGKSEEQDESQIPTPSQEIKGVKPILVYAVELLFSNAEHRNEIFESLLKNGKKHNTRNVLVFIYYCTIPIEERSDKEQKIIMLEQYLTEQEKRPPLDNVSLEKSSASEEQVKNRLLQLLSLDSTGAYYFFRDLADYPGTTDLEWVAKIKNRKQELLSLA